jgi:hypothetical protein
MQFGRVTFKPAPDDVVAVASRKRGGAMGKFRSVGTAARQMIPRARRWMV